MISEQVIPDTVFAFTEPENTMVVHPLNYSYMAQHDIFAAHAANMEWILARVEAQAQAAMDRIDDMVDQMDSKYEPRMITFLYGTEVTENEDGSFSFFAKGAPGPFNEALEEELGKPDLWCEQQLQYIDEVTQKDIDRVLPSFDDIVHGNGVWMDEPKDFDLFTDIQPLTPVFPAARHARKSTLLEKLKGLFHG